MVPIMVHFFLAALISALGIMFAAWLSRDRARRFADAVMQQADREAEGIRHAAELETMKGARQLAEVRHSQEQELARAEERLKSREKQFSEQLANLKRREGTLSNREAELERVAEMTRDEARAQLMEKMEVELTQRQHARLAEAEEQADVQAARVIATAIGRLAVPCVSEATVTTVPLPSDEMKGRIIGREGRNIRAFEAATGVNVLIDDTPSAVVLSGMDPIRKHIAKYALTELVVDGRIHPTRIEEAVKRAREGVDEEVRLAGERAAMKAGVHGLHSELIRHLGLLNFRFSYGQNVLEHSIEVSSLLGMMCAELGLDEQLGRRIGLLHDVGKAISHERGGTHAQVGADLARKCGEDEKTANGIACHHDEIVPTTIEGSLCGTADALSGARPGARMEAVDSYVKRIGKLEALAKEHPGVKQAYAVQAGRELRVMVEPTEIDDAEATALAHRLAKQVQATLTYPGKIRVVVMRERRSVVYA
jgi:ribonucrease Y